MIKMMNDEGYWHQLLEFPSKPHISFHIIITQDNYTAKEYEYILIAEAIIK